jgi:hypothetical protein
MHSCRQNDKSCIAPLVTSRERWRVMELALDAEAIGHGLLSARLAAGRV